MNTKDTTLVDQFMDAQKQMYDEREWQKFRKEAAKDILCSFQPYAHDNDTEDHLVSTAVRLADKLIAKLKEK